VLRFFGDDAIFRAQPENSGLGYSAAGVLFPDEISPWKAGDPFRAPGFHQRI